MNMQVVLSMFPVPSNRGEGEWTFEMSVGGKCGTFNTPFENSSPLPNVPGPFQEPPGLEKPGGFWILSSPWKPLILFKFQLRKSPPLKWDNRDPGDTVVIDIPRGPMKIVLDIQPPVHVIMQLRVPLHDINNIKNERTIVSMSGSPSNGSSPKGQHVQGNPAREAEVARMKASGASVPVIAETLQCSPATVYNVLSKQEVKELVERETSRLVELVPSAMENLKSLVQGMNRARTPEERKLGWEATRKVLESTGLLASGAPSVRVQQLTINQQNIQLVSPVVLEALRRSCLLGLETLSNAPGLTVDCKPCTDSHDVVQDEPGEDKQGMEASDGTL
jgi:hypothetical protein